MSEPIYVYARPQPSWHETVTGRILGLNVVMFIAQIILDDKDKHFTNSWALSLEGLREGHWWQLLTFQVLHGGFLHLLLNSLMIYVMGRALEEFIGGRKLLMLYFFGGIMGGLLEMGIQWRWPSEAPIGVVGASAGAFALVAAFATMFPFQRLKVFLFLVIPVAMNARTLLWLSMAFTLGGMAGLYHDHIAHAGHMGGILWGIVYSRLRLRRLVGPPPLP